MKKFILIASSVSILCAGPVITPLVDYDQQDIIEAETTVKQKLILPETKPQIITTPGVRKKSFTYEIDLLAGRNFVDNSSVLKDANTIGIRLNKYITDDVAIQIGYDRIFDADYKFKSEKNADTNTANNGTTRCAECPAPGAPSCEPNDGNQNNGDNGSENDGFEQENNGNQDNGGDDTGNSDNGDQNDDGNDAGNSDNNDQNDGGNDTGNSDNDDQNDGGNGNGGSQHNEDTGDQGTQNPISNSSIQNATQSTDVDRFYINVLKEVHSEKTHFIPYFFAGLGYEHINDKNLGIDSQGFFNTGGGLKYSLDKKFRLVSEAKVIKKFKDSDLDIVAMLGVGMLFGEKKQQSVPNKPKITEVDIAPQQQDLSLIIQEEAPVKIAPLPVLDVTESLPTVKLPTSSDTASKHAYYVQVAVVSTENAMDNYIQRLEKYGLSYEIKSFHDKGKQLQRILAGPYMSRTEARENLPAVKKIEKSAFIKKL